MVCNCRDPFDSTFHISVCRDLPQQVTAHAKQRWLTYANLARWMTEFISVMLTSGIGILTQYTAIQTGTEQRHSHWSAMDMRVILNQSM